MVFSSAFSGLNFFSLCAKFCGIRLAFPLIERYEFGTSSMISTWFLLGSWLVRMLVYDY